MGEEGGWPWVLERARARWGTRGTGWRVRGGSGRLTLGGGLPWPHGGVRSQEQAQA